MADKDEFKFDDDDTFPETDLSSAFSDGEQSTSNEPEYPMTIKKAGGSKTKLLLLLLLLVLVGGGAAYYFLMMEEPPPPPPPPKKIVAAPKPAPPPAPAVAPAPPPAPAKPATAAVPAPAPAPAKPVAAAVPAPPPEPAKPATASKLIASDGPWLIEAGAYVSAAELKSVKQKVRALGYEPQVSTMKKTVRMTRLRVGSYPESEAKEALAYARGIAPDAFVMHTGGTVTIYAGTYLNPENLHQMAERFSGEGVSVAEEPVDVKRTVSLVRFGGFPDEAAAGQTAAKVRREGVAATVIKGK